MILEITFFYKTPFLIHHILYYGHYTGGKMNIQPKDTPIYSKRMYSHFVFYIPSVQLYFLFQS